MINKSRIKTNSSTIVKCFPDACYPVKEPDIDNDQHDSGHDDIPLIRLKNVRDHIDSNNLDLVTIRKWHAYPGDILRPIENKLKSKISMTEHTIVKHKITKQ